MIEHPDAAPQFVPGTVMAVQADDWFMGPDGQDYRRAFGPCYVLKARDFMGFEPKNSANWFMQVGHGPRAVVIAGCKLHYALPNMTTPPKSPSCWDARDPVEGSVP